MRRITRVGEFAASRSLNGYAASGRPESLLFGQVSLQPKHAAYVVVDAGLLALSHCRSRGIELDVDVGIEPQNRAARTSGIAEGVFRRMFWFARFAEESSSRREYGGGGSRSSLNSALIASIADGHHASEYAFGYSDLRAEHNIKSGEKSQSRLRGVFGFILGFGTVAIVEIFVVYVIGELLNSRIIPRGPGWVFIPVMAGVAGWKLLRDVNFAGAFGHAVHEMTTINRLNRLLVAVYGSWTLIVGGYAFFADSYGYRISNDECLQILKILMVPMAVLTAIVFLFRWALRR